MNRSEKKINHEYFKNEKARNTQKKYQSPNLLNLGKMKTITLGKSGLGPDVGGRQL